MEVNDLYVAPVTVSLELNYEGVICLSPGDYPGWDEESI